MPARTLIAALLLAACNVTDADDERTDRLEEARRRWQQSGLENYAYVFRASCECLPSFTSPALVVVRGDTIDSVTAVQGGEVVDQAPYRTVDGLFDLIADAIEQGTDSFEVEYDAQYGYPTLISIDQDVQIADDEFVYWASELAVIT